MADPDSDSDSEELLTDSEADLAELQAISVRQLDRIRLDGGGGDSSEVPLSSWLYATPPSPALPDEASANLRRRAKRAVRQPWLSKKAVRQKAALLAVYSSLVGSSKGSLGRQVTWWRDDLQTFKTLLKLAEKEDFVGCLAPILWIIVSSLPLTSPLDRDPIGRCLNRLGASQAFRHASSAIDAFVSDAPDHSERARRNSAKMVLQGHGFSGRSKPGLDYGPVAFALNADGCGGVQKVKLRVGGSRQDNFRFVEEELHALIKFLPRFEPAHNDNWLSRALQDPLLVTISTEPSARTEPFILEITSTIANTVPPTTFFDFLGCDVDATSVRTVRELTEHFITFFPAGRAEGTAHDIARLRAYHASIQPKAPTLVSTVLFKLADLDHRPDSRRHNAAMRKMIWERNWPGITEYSFPPHLRERLNQIKTCQSCNGLFECPNEAVVDLVDVSFRMHRTQTPARRIAVSDHAHTLCSVCLPFHFLRAEYVASDFRHLHAPHHDRCRDDQGSTGRCRCELCTDMPRRGLWIPTPAGQQTATTRAWRVAPPPPDCRDQLKQWCNDILEEEARTGRAPGRRTGPVMPIFGHNPVPMNVRAGAGFGPAQAGPFPWHFGPAPPAYQPPANQVPAGGGLQPPPWRAQLAAMAAQFGLPPLANPPVPGPNPPAHAPATAPVQNTATRPGPVAPAAANNDGDTDW